MAGAGTVITGSLLAGPLSVDDAVGTIVRTMRREGRNRNTLFIYTSDNGYLWGEHGLVGKDAPYAAATRVPLVVRWDGHVAAGGVDRRLAVNVDIAATPVIGWSGSLTTLKHLRRVEPMLALNLGTRGIQEALHGISQLTQQAGANYQDTEQGQITLHSRASLAAQDVFAPTRLPACWR